MLHDVFLRREHRREFPIRPNHPAQVIADPIEALRLIAWQMEAGRQVYLPPTAKTHLTVEALLEQMDAAAQSGDMKAHKRHSEELAVFTRGYMVPTIAENWTWANLTNSERLIADLLLLHIGKAVPKSALMDVLYSAKAGDEPGSKIVDIFICKIRKKLENSPFRIDTIVGNGFRLEKVKADA